MKRFINLGLVWAAAASLVFAVVSPANAQISEIEKKLARAAKKEGSVVLINALLQDSSAKALEKAMIKRYDLGSGFKLKNIRKKTGAVVATTRQEIKAGKIISDVIMVVGSPFFAAAAERGAFVKLNSAHWKNHADTVKKAGQYSNYPYVLTVLPYTFMAVWNASCPGMANIQINSYQDLLNPALKGKTIVSDITKSTSYAATTVGLKQSGFDIRGFWKKYKSITQPIIDMRTEPKMQRVISCERPLDMWNMPGRVYQNIQKKPELKKSLRFSVYKEGQVMLGQHLAVLKGSPHPNAGKLLVEFLLTKEGTDIVIEHEVVFSFLKGYTPPASVRAYLPDPKKMKMLGLNDWVGLTKPIKAERKFFRKVFK